MQNHFKASECNMCDFHDFSFTWKCQLPLKPKSTLDDFLHEKYSLGILQLHPHIDFSLWDKSENWDQNCENHTSVMCMSATSACKKIAKPIS